MPLFTFYAKEGVMLSRIEDFMKEYARWVITSYGAPFPLVAVEADDVFLTDMEGRRYLDFWAAYQ